MARLPELSFLSPLQIVGLLYAAFLVGGAAGTIGYHLLVGGY